MNCTTSPLAKKATPEDLEKLLEGFVLDQGFVKAKEVSFVKNDPHEIGMEIHSNRSASCAGCSSTWATKW